MQNWDGKVVRENGIKSVEVSREKIKRRVEAN